MSKPLFLVGELPAGDRYTLDGPEGHHAATVQRLRAGEQLLLTDGRGALVEATVRAAGRGSLDLALGARRYEPAPPVRLVAVQGLAKGDRGELAVQAMTEAGADEIVPWSAARAIVQWRGERGEKAHCRWVDTAREAAKQARRAWLPVMSPLAASPGVCARISTASLALVLHEAAAHPISTVELPAAGELVLVIGPEGGITHDELVAFQDAGAVPVRLGQTVLRTSTAGVAAIAALSPRLGRW